MMDDLPTILVVSSSSTKPKSIIKLITKDTPTEIADTVKQPWKIDTKYYSAIVNLIGIEAGYKRNEEFNGKVEAVLIHMDSNKAKGLGDLEQWSGLLEETDPEIKLLLVNYCNDQTKVTLDKATEWCLLHNFELIELYPSSPSDESDIIPEKFGVNRVIEALQAHTWSNLVMKKKPTKRTIEAEDLEDDDFTELFSHLHMMKDSLQSLPVNQRKQCAEQMVSAFWKAIGGDEEEVIDLTQ